MPGNFAALDLPVRVPGDAGCIRATVAARRRMPAGVTARLARRMCRRMRRASPGVGAGLPGVGERCRSERGQQQRERNSVRGACVASDHFGFHWRANRRASPVCAGAMLQVSGDGMRTALARCCPHARSPNAKPRDDRGASQDRHVAMASFRRVTATYAGAWLPASGSNCSECHR